MEKIPTRLANIRNLLGRTSRVVPIRPLEVCREEVPKAGQAWRITHDGDLPSRLVLVIDGLTLEDDGEQASFFNVAPLFAETEMAGPDDLVLPPRAMGFRCAAALGLTVTIARDAFSELVGNLSKDWTEKAVEMEAVLASGEPWVPGSSSAPPYLDDRDLRLGFHEELVEQMAPFQQSALESFYEGAQAAGPTIIPFPFSQKRGLPWTGTAGAVLGILPAALFPLAAADSQQGSDVVEFDVEGIGLRLRLRLEPGRENVGCQVFDGDGNPRYDLDGVSILGAGGLLAGKIESSQARFPTGTIKDGFSLQDESGSEVTLAKLEV